MPKHATSAGKSSSVTADARLARDVARILSPKAVLDTSGSESFANELRARGTDVVLFDGAHAVPSSSRFDLITCVPGPVRFSLDTLEQIRPFSDRILFIPPQDVSTPFLAWLTNFSAYGFAPDPEFDPGPLGSRAVLFTRGPVWPPDALRVFAGWLHVRNSAQRLDEIEAEQQRFAVALQKRPAGGTQIPMGVDLFPSPQEETQFAHTGNAELTRRIEALERAVTELGRAHDGMNRRVEEILLSRTWKTLTGIGAIPLRILGRKA